uniref:Probable zinc-ribbon domain-containing protein n=1 Tax=Oryza glumipatula TaxID=40148 RepID=A0A0E0A0Q6_9ORYZ
MQSEEVKMRFGRCPYCRAMIYQNPKAVIFYCSRCRTPIRGKNPEPTDEAEYALSRLEILSADTASVFSDEPEDAGSDRRADEVRPLSRRTRRPSSSSDWTTTTDSERSEEAFYTPRNAQEGRPWQSPSPVSSQELGASGGGGGLPRPPDEPGAVAAARLMDPAFHKELLHALDNLRSLIVTIEQPRPASGGGGRALTRRDSRLFRRLESQLERALPPQDTASTSASSSSCRGDGGGGGGGRPSAPARREGTDPCRPVLGGAPFVICGKCSELLRTPPPPRPRRRRWTTRIRCGECNEVLELSLPAGGVPAQHRPIRTCSAPLVSDHHRPLPRRLE